MLASLLTFSAAIAALISGTRAAPVDKPTPTVKRDVWVPKILVPNAETKWVLGTRYNVTWDTSDAPANITNSKGMVTFDIGGQIVPSGEYGSLDDPLANDFDITQGWVTITTPDYLGCDAEVTLFGDSGNISPDFCIIAPPRYPSDPQPTNGNGYRVREVEKKRDVFDPTIISPNAQTTWTVGQQVNVTWDTSDAPEQISNGSLVTLDVNDVTVSSGPGSLDDPLAQGFDLRQGWVTITVPDVEPGCDYQITLFGDSGNFSPSFCIQSASN